jgi:putative RecB family exonuclease
MSTPTPSPEVYSHSRLSSFESCPKKFEYRYLQRIVPESESIEGFLGKRVHEVLERLYRFTRNGRVPSLPRVLQRFRTLWEEHYDAERVRVVREEMHADIYRESGERCLENYYRRHYPFDADETLGVEQRVAFALDDRGRYRMQGVIDRVVRARDGGIEIHDYKTGARVPRQQQLDRDRQLALYQLGMAPRYGRSQPFRLVWHYLLSNQERRSTRSAEQLEELRRATMGLIDRIRAETEYEPKPGPLCRWCEYRDRCPAQQSAPPTVPQPSAQRAASQAAEGRAQRAEGERSRRPGAQRAASQAAEGRAQRAEGERSQTTRQLPLL